MEVRWPGLSGIDFVRRLAARLCEPRLVIFTACADHDTIVESVAAGALGYLIKPTIPGYLVAAISEAAQGRSVLCGQAQDAVTNLMRRIGASKRCRTLSWREREVMLLLTNGASSSDIARKFSIEEGTVHRHLHNIFKKLHVHSKVDARRRFAGGGKLLLSWRRLKMYRSCTCRWLPARCSIGA
jgi:DNA-binding NarL/FixJ family response regulator